MRCITGYSSLADEKMHALRGPARGLGATRGRLGSKHTCASVRQDSELYRPSLRVAGVRLPARQRVQRVDSRSAQAISRGSKATDLGRISPRAGR